MIEVRGLSFSYRKACVFHDVSFDAKDGEIVGILGTNGVGKSTLVKCINGINRPSSGVILIDGKDTSLMSVREIARLVSYVPQDGKKTGLSVFDTVLLGRKPYMQWRAGREDVRITESVIGEMGLGKMELKSLENLSGGEVQKVMLARAMVQRPRVLVLDEPTNNLDPKNQYGMMEMVKRIARNGKVSVLVVLHDLNFALAYADRIFFMKDGTGRMYDSSIVDSSLIYDVYGIRSDVMEIKGRRFVLLGGNG